MTTKLIGEEGIPSNGITITAEILKDWSKQINDRGYDAPDSEHDWLELIKDAVRKDQEFDEYN